MSETPETDEAIVDISGAGVKVRTQYVRADFTRKLELELNSFRLIKKFLIAEVIEERDQARRERDEARAEATEYRDADAETHGVERIPLPWEDQPDEDR